MNVPQTSRFLRAFSLRAFMAWVVLLSPLAAAKGAAPSAVDALTPQSVAALTLRPARLLSDPMFASLPIEVVEAAAQKYLGISASSVSRITAVVEPPMGMQPYYAIVANLEEPIHLDSLHGELQTLLAEFATLEELDGRAYYKAHEPFAPSLYMLDDQTLVAAPIGMIKKLIRQHASAGEAQVAASQLAQAMRAEGGDLSDVHAAAMIEPVRPLIQLGLSQARQEIEPRFHKYLEVVDLLKGVVFGLDFSGQNDTSITIYANNEADADKLGALLDDVIEMVRAQTFDDPAGPYAELRASGDPVKMAMADYMVRSHTEGVEQLRSLRQGADRFELFRVNTAEPNTNPMVITAAAGILVALLLPAVQAAREAARRNQSMNNMKQMMLALLNHEAAYNRLPAQAITADDGTPLLSWRVAILPYMEGQGLYERFHLDEPWDSPHNIQLLPLMPDVFIDPSGALEAHEGKTHYLGVAGPNAFFTDGPQGRGIRNITDGTSKTIAIVQVDDAHAVEWTKPVDFDSQLHQENPLGGIGTMHPAIFLAAFVDGHIESISEDVNPETLRALFTINGHEAVQLP